MTLQRCDWRQVQHEVVDKLHVVLAGGAAGPRPVLLEAAAACVLRGLQLPDAQEQVLEDGCSNDVPDGALTAPVLA